MCFTNLPVEFDDEGRAYLREGVADPYGVKTSGGSRLVGHGAGPGGGVGTLPAVAGAQVEVQNLTEFTIDPVTRVAGALGFHTTCDLPSRRVVDAHSYATLFRGYELILKGRDPRDAIDICSRACGVCGGVHSTTASMALEMALPVVPPPMGILARNLGETAEFLYDHPLHLFMLAGPDFSELMVKATNPELWAAAQKTSAPHADIHGYATIAEIMTALNPLTGRLYLEGLEYTRTAREMCVIMYGKYPHPSTVVPGGLSTNLSFTSFNEYYKRLVQSFDYAKKCVGVWDDVYDFFLTQNPDYAKVGERPANMIDLGIFDDVDAYDATYANCNEWGEQRWSTPGVIINGELRTTKLQQIHIGTEEFVEHSFYEEWGDPQFQTDPAGNPISPFHMWNKQTIVKPTGRNWREKYSWATTPRWDRTVMEAGAYARLWVTAMAQKHPTNPFYEATGTSIKMLLPKGRLPEMELEWKIPDTLNALERNRARAYCVPWMTLIAMNCWLQIMERWKAGETKTASPFKMPKRGTQLGVGFWGAGRGYLSHNLVIENGKIANYQILTPSTWNASPRDPFDKPGAYEEAVMNSPILEQTTPEKFQGLDIQRAIRSFDPCMPCTTHIQAGDRLVVRDVNSCACTLEEELAQ